MRIEKQAGGARREFAGRIMNGRESRQMEIDKADFNSARKASGLAALLPLLWHNNLRYDFALSGFNRFPVWAWQPTY